APARAGGPGPPQRGRSRLAPVAARESCGETEHTLEGTRKLFLRGGGGSWKTILSLPRDRDDIPVREEWYVLAADPAEHHDARPSPERVADLRRRALGRFVEDRGRAAAAPEVRLPAEQRQRLRALR